MHETSNRSMTPWVVTSLDPFKLERVVDCVWRQTRRLSSRLAKLLSSRHCRERTGASSHWLRKPLSAQLPEEQCMKVGDANVGSLRFFGKSFGCVQDTRGACKKLNAVRCWGVYYTIKALNDSRHFTYEKHYRALLWHTHRAQEYIVALTLSMSFIKWASIHGGVQERKSIITTWQSF